MRNKNQILFSLFSFFCISSFNAGIGIMIYANIKDMSKTMISILILLQIFLTTLIFFIIDYIKKNITISKPIREILYATKQITKGDFNISLEINHSYNNYDTFDLIKNDLNKMALELKKSEVLKNDFIANVSHEIKTPISVIMNYAELLNDNNLTIEEKKCYINNLTIACKRLNNLVTNILSLNKLENQKILKDKKSFNISKLLIDKIIQYENILENKNINLICNIEEDLYLNSIESYIEIIFNNLISNALKFTNENGNIEISFNKKENKYIFIVKDDGIGMDNETGSRIFEKFYQADQSHYKEGNGLGLALVKKVIDIIGGKISVSSKLNEGTTFKVILKEE